MQFVAKIKRIPFSPYKLRPIVDVIRGKSATYALQWLATYKIKRVCPIQKMIESAVANAKNQAGVSVTDLIIKEIRVDEAGMYKYHKPGAMGRASIQRKRFSHANVVVESVFPNKLERKEV